jgi:hypothetical protein
VLLRDLFLKPSLLIRNIDSLSEGMTNGLNLEDRTQFADVFIVEEV